MESSEKEELNATQGREVKVPCSECSRKTCHMVMLSLDTSREYGEDYPVLCTTNYQIIQCQGCKTISFRKFSSNSDGLFEQISENEWVADPFEELYPSRIEGRKGIKDGIWYLPDNVERIYRETLQALNSRCPVLAGIGLATLIEAVCKEKDASGNNLFLQIDSLVEKRILTPVGAKILHNIRTLRNQAAHEVIPHNESQLHLAMDVVEHLVADVYILPKRVEEEFGK